MANDTETLKALVEDELARTADTRVTTQIRSLLIEPTPVIRDWDYGVKGQQFVCWNVLEYRVRRDPRPMTKATSTRYRHLIGKCRQQW